MDGVRITTKQRVVWSDTDASGHHHFLAVLRWVEAGETLLHEALGVADDIAGRMPRVHVEVDYTDRLWFRDVVEVTVAVERVGTSSVEYTFTVRREGSPETAAHGRLVAVYVDQDGKATALPDSVRSALAGSSSAASASSTSGSASSESA